MNEVIWTICVTTIPGSPYYLFQCLIIFFLYVHCKSVMRTVENKMTANAATNML